MTWFFTRYIEYYIIVLSTTTNIEFNGNQLDIDNESMKNSLHQVNSIIKNNISEFDITINVLKKKNQKLFNQILLSIQSGNTKKSSLPTIKILQVAKTMKLMIQLKLILEQLELKFSTVKKTNDIIQIVSLAIETIKQLQINCNKINQQYKKNLFKLSVDLNDLLLNNLNCKSLKSTSNSITKETKDILHETSLIADNIMKHNLPRLPSEFNTVNNE